MAKKKGKLTQSQINGITCIAVVLVVVSCLYFFSGNDTQKSSTTDTISAQNIEKLEKKEDSVYRSRRPQRSSRKYHTHYQHQSDKTTPNLYSTEVPVPTRKPLIVELNSADTTTLQLLHGIGPAYARRIVRYRERLGGFHSYSQLLEVYGFTPELLAHISPHLQLDSLNLRKISINTVELKQLIKHPYVEYYFARDLVNLRSRGITFANPDDLRAIPSCTDTMLSKLLPYLDFQ